jgi:hypothetical protein
MGINENITKIKVLNANIYEIKKEIEKAIKNKKKVSHLRIKLNNLKELKKQILKSGVSSINIAEMALP